MEEFDTSIKIFKILCPFDVNINYRKKIVAKDNTIRNLLLNDEAILKLLSDSNKLDIRLYKYVKEILFPAQKEKYDEKLKQMKDGYEKYKSSRTTKYQSSVIFNKFIFRQILKFRKTE